VIVWPFCEKTHVAPAGKELGRQDSVMGWLDFQFWRSRTVSSSPSRREIQFGARLGCGGSGNDCYLRDADGGRVRLRNRLDGDGCRRWNAGWSSVIARGIDGAKGRVAALRSSTYQVTAVFVVPVTVAVNGCTVPV